MGQSYIYNKTNLMAQKLTDFFVNVLPGFNDSTISKNRINCSVRMLPPLIQIALIPSTIVQQCWVHPSRRMHARSVHVLMI